MANFLITSPNSLTQGTESNDLFVLNTALGDTIFGNGANDQISAAGAINGVNSILNGGQGNDTIYLTAGVPTLTVAKAVGGGGNDLIVIDGAVAGNATVHGGGGADTIQLSAGVYTQSIINGNGGLDLVSGSGATLVSSLLSLGGGNDTLNFLSASGQASTIAAGGGADLISATFATGSAVRIEGDTVGDTEFFGNDTIRIGGTLVGESALVQGGGGADLLTITAANLGTGSTLNGNAGLDSITLGPVLASANLLIGGGAGSDSITVSATLLTGFGSIFGGGGNDVIQASADTTGAGGFIFGGLGADSIGIGTITAGLTAVNIRYTAFDQSNLAAFDSISASTAASGHAFVVSQDVVTASTGGGLNNAAFTTDTGGLVTWVSAAGNGVTARATQVDQFLSKGQTVVFADGAGNSYLFIQAGNAGSGVDSDFIAQLNTSTLVGSGLVIAGGTAIQIALA